MPVLAIWTPEGGLFGAVAPLGLAAAAGSALVVDLDPAGPAYPGPASLATLVAEGPRRADLNPARRGVAVLRNGGVEAAAAAQVIAALVAGWPSVVLRVPSGGRQAPRLPGAIAAPIVPVRMLSPGFLAPPPSGRPAVYQRTGFRSQPPGPGPVLPVPRPSSVAALLTGVLPAPDRWVGRWRDVWRYPWV